MAVQAVRARNPAGHGGLIRTLLALAADLAALAETRFALFVKESKSTLVQIVVLIACLLVAVLFFALGYIFLIASVVVAVAHFAQMSWVWIALIAAGCHFLLALIALLVARTRMIKAPYPELSAELKKDREWLKNLETTSRSTN
jgi:uncharacterized membrane protein YqjE